MPPKKGQAKKKRIPHANETPLKDKQPGHGAVERAKNQMWSSSSSDQQRTTASSTPAAGVARPKYKATSTIIGMGMGGIGIGRGGGGGGVKKKKMPAAAAVATKQRTTPVGSVGTTAVGRRSNPDADFFGGPPL
ncbi:hypothetical protein ACHAXR_003450 [Thalassiosira sp. AJA248-18]